jgi:hypothetical protein
MNEKGLEATAAAGSALTCFGHLNAFPCVYFLDGENVVHELAWTEIDGWTNTELPGIAASGSDLTCFEWDGFLPRVYYFDPDHDHGVSQLAWAGTGWARPVLMGGPAASGTKLTCFENRASGFPTNLFYLDPAGTMNQIWDGGGGNPYQVYPLAAAAAPGSALTCLAAGGRFTRLYFLDPRNQLSQLAYSQSPNASDPDNSVDVRVQPASPAPGTALTCFGVYGADPRVYYLDADHHINELAWVTSAENTAVQAVPVPVGR